MMPNLDLHPDIIAFISSITKLETILREHEFTLWASKLVRVRQLAEKSDGYSVELFLSYLGGMGSLNDIILTSSSSADKEFYDERERACYLAKALAGST